MWALRVMLVLKPRFVRLIGTRMGMAEEGD